MEQLLDPAAADLFSEDALTRLCAVRSLGKRGLHLSVLEQVAESDADPRVGLTAAMWLAVHGREIWLSHLRDLRESLADPLFRELASQLYAIAESAAKS